LDREESIEGEDREKKKLKKIKGEPKDDWGLFLSFWGVRVGLIGKPKNSLRKKFWIGERKALCARGKADWT